MLAQVVGAAGTNMLNPVMVIDCGLVLITSIIMPPLAEPGCEGQDVYGAGNTPAGLALPVQPTGMGAVRDAEFPAPQLGGLGGEGGDGGGGGASGGGDEGDGSTGQAEVRLAFGVTYFTAPVHGRMLPQLAVFQVVACMACDRRRVPSVTSVMNGSDALKLPITTPFVARLDRVLSIKRNHRPMVSLTASGMDTLPGMSTIGCCR